MSDNTPNMLEKIRQALTIPRWNLSEHGNYIRSAPEWLRYLLDENERQRIALHTHESYDKTVGELYEENQQLQAQLDAKDTEIAELRRHHQGYVALTRTSVEQNGALKAQVAAHAAAIAMMVELLTWYANEAEDEARRFHFGMVKSDIGQHARDFLQSLKEPNT
ncbi:hypothetical protein ACFSR7_35935 [Cohnella sp. GCM10020058]|uniref:hypothetical protein n=1 Tax=Cohnella sp. GCM10020058 TaxID=3317330 RepID=UPI0036453955